MAKQTPAHIESRISKIRGIKKGPSPFRKTTEQIISELKSVHGDKFLYDKINYKNSSTKIEVGCRTHGYFWKFPNDLKRSNGGCPICNNSFNKTSREFIAEAKLKFPDYNYSNVVYKNAHTKIEIVCPEHGLFKIKPNTLLSGIGCGKCGIIKSLQSRIKNGGCRHPDDIPEYEKYRRTVWKESNKNFNLYLLTEKRDKDNHLDHIVSISDGWQNNVPPEIIGSVVNLRIISGTENRKKSNKSDMSVDMLYNLYNRRGKL